MEIKNYTITLNNGVVLNNLKLNGNNFISETPITEEMFEGNLSQVVINDGVHDRVYNNMQLVQISHYGATEKKPETYWFILRAIPEKELQDIKVRADIDYLAMMTDIEL